MEIKSLTVKKILTVLFLVFILITLVRGMSLEHEDKKETPLKQYYIENRQTTGSDNIVSGILLDYRAYDTFGEVMVLYVAITGVIILGIKSKENNKEKQSSKGGENS